MIHVEVGRVCLHYCQACRMLVKVGKVHLTIAKHVVRLVEVCSVRFDHRQACRMLVEVRRVSVDHH